MSTQTERRARRGPTQGASLAEIEAVYRDSYGRFLAVAAMLCEDRELWRDAVQDGFARAIRSRSSFRGSGSLEGWLWRIVVNSAHSIARRPQPVPAAAPEGNRAATSTDDDAGLALLAELPGRQRTVLFLRYYAELDYRTIADVLEVQVGTVGSTVNAALVALRRRTARTVEP